MTVVEESQLDTLSVAERSRYSSFMDEHGKEVFQVCLDADFESELAYLKAKIEAGANFIITQMFFDAMVFDSFVQACRGAGITVPIIPGIMCISNYNGFKRMTKLCKNRVPQSLLDVVEGAKDDELAMKEVGFKLGVDLCKQLLDLAGLRQTGRATVSRKTSA